MSIISEIEESWSWVGIEPEEVIYENDFGNLIIRDRSGKYWRLCPEDIYCEVVANNKDEFDALSKDPEFVEDWSMDVLVEQAKEKYGALLEGRKYCLVTPGVIGGKYDISNINTAPLVEIIRFSGDLGKQIKDMPDGAKIEIKVVD